MNHLAHFLLSGDDEEITIGNFIADFIRNGEVKAYSVGIREGIRLHRRIDTFTDSHPVFRESTKRLHPHQHKYAPVVVDIYYDYLLGRNWDRYAPKETDLHRFVSKTYALLERNVGKLPQKLRDRLPMMIEDNFLIKYTTFEGLEETFKRMESRVKFDNNFKNAAAYLRESEELFDREFNVFFSEMMDMVRQIQGKPKSLSQVFTFT